MRFRVLGPLELSARGRAVEVNGTKQRAALAYLLFNANRVVSTSELLDILWPNGETPNSARKILHNAIWGLRGVLAPDDSDEGRVSLITRSPGYVLQLEPEQIDLHRFHRMASEGRAQLSAGEHDRAAETLLRALGLWRGAVLADLVEAGLGWPELTALESVRVDALEDFFDAELGRGRHHAVLREIEATAEHENLRERLCGQLMLALYRCGRQTDALEAYNRMRARLVDDLGLEPGTALQELQSAILRHDDHLLGAPAEPVTVGARRAAGTALRVVERARPVVAAVPAPVPPAPRGPVPVRPRPETAGPPVTDVETRREEVLSVLVAQVSLATDAEPDPARVEREISAFRAGFRHAVDLLGGTMSAGSGSAPMAWFHGGADLAAAERAVSAALAVLAPSLECVTVRAAVTTGEAVLYRLPNEGEVVIAGPVAGGSQALLARTTPGTARACDATRALTEGAVTYGPATPGLGGSRVRATHWHSVTHPSIPIVDRDWELDLLSGLVERSKHRDISQLVTLVGDSGVGKTRLLREFERRAVARWDSVEFLMSGPDAATSPFGPLRDLLLTLCAVDPAQRPGVDRVGALRTLVTTYIADLTLAEHLVSALACLVVDDQPPVDRAQVAAALEAGTTVLRAVAADHPLVLFVDDAHELDDAVLDFLVALSADGAPPAVVVVLAARPDLLSRRPDWAGGHPHAATITMAPLSDAAIDRLSDVVVSGVRKRRLALPTCRLHAGIVDQERPRQRAAMRVLMQADTLPVLPAHAVEKTAPARCADGDQDTDDETTRVA